MPQIVRRHARHDGTSPFAPPPELRCVGLILKTGSLARASEPPRSRVARPEVAAGLGGENKLIGTLEQDRTSHYRVEKGRIHDGPTLMRLRRAHNHMPVDDDSVRRDVQSAPRHINICDSKARRLAPPEACV